jgi:GT2 family glycosyltransferase
MEEREIYGANAGLLSIIIVNYHSTALILQCLASVYEHTKGLSFEVIVADNSNNPAEKKEILSRYPSVRWIEMGYNAGFARANNAGMKAAEGNVFLLLNPDTIIIDSAITGSFKKLKEGPFAAAGVQQLNADGTPQISGNFFVKGGLNHLLPIPYWGDLVRWAGYKAKSKVPNVRQAKELEEVDWISGAYLMVKREVVDRVGMMDDDFFLYAEEVEWCSRLKKAGKLCIFGDLNIIHLEGATINKSQNLEEKGYYNLYDRKGLQLMVSNHLRVRKQCGVGWFLILLLNYTWGVFFFWICSTLGRLFTLRNPFKEWNRVGAFGHNVLRLWALATTIIRNKPHFYKMF